jgi:hypothetical protein
MLSVVAGIADSAIRPKQDETKVLLSTIMLLLTEAVMRGAYRETVAVRGSEMVVLRRSLIEYKVARINKFSGDNLTGDLGSIELRVHFTSNAQIIPYPGLNSASAFVLELQYRSVVVEAGPRSPSDDTLALSL